MKTLPVILAGVGLTAALAFAQRGQGPRTPPDPATMVQHRVDFLASQLNLTDTQKSQASQIFTDAISQGQNARTAVQNARTQLAAAVKANDANGITNAAMVIGTNEGSLTAIQAKADAAFYALLTADQKTKYDAMPHGPGGFGGGRGGFGAQGHRPPQ
jgi:Spy/CpxP family protein refolding chaperone